MEDSDRNLQKSLSPVPFKEPENMTTIELNRTSITTEELNGNKTKKKIKIKYPKINKPVLTFILCILAILCLIMVILLIRGYTNVPKFYNNTSMPDEMSFKLLMNNQNKIDACKLSKSIEECCYIFLKTNTSHKVEKCTVQKVLNLFLQYEIQANKRSKRQVYEQFDHPGHPYYDQNSADLNQNYYSTEDYRIQHPEYFQRDEYINTDVQYQERNFERSNNDQYSTNSNFHYNILPPNLQPTTESDYSVNKKVEKQTSNRKNNSTTKLRKKDYVVKKEFSPSSVTKTSNKTNITAKPGQKPTSSGVKQSSKPNGRISQGTDFGKQVEMQTSIQDKQVVNPCFYPFPSPFYPPGRTSAGYNPNQLFTVMPPQQQPLYIINPPMYPYLPLQYHSYNYPNPQMINRNPITVASAGGQYFMCNPVSVSSNNVANMPGVEVRKMQEAFTLQDMVQLMPKASSSNKTRAAMDCPMGEQGCNDGSKCIHIKQVCDNEVDCDDGSDEENCSCKKRIWDMRLCDGYLDCPNGEDEEDCFECAKDEFSCDDWSKVRRGTCIPINQKCDGIRQCELTGKDEEDCSILTDHLGHHPLYKVSNAVGFLHRNYKGEWYPTCFGVDIFALDVCRMEAGPSGILPRVQLVVNTDNYFGPFIDISPNNKMILQDSCSENKVAFVECSPLFCGLRLVINNPFRSSEVDTSAEELLNHLQRLSKPPSEEIVGSSRVVGGKPSQPAAWPWVVSIYKNGFFHCGGVLINELWIVTAAHCVNKFWLFYYEIQAGALRRFSYSPMGQSRRAVLAIPHEDYSKKTLKNDIALMKLSKPVRFNRFVRPICLPSEATAGEDFFRGPKPNTVCVTVGWGATVEHGTDPDHLREVEIPILSHCKHVEDQEGDEICAGLLEGGKDACQGDSGGPLMCQNVKNRSQWYLAGIVSHGEGCARPNEPGVYTKVSRYVGWIGESINGKTMGQIPLQKCPGYVCKGTKRCLPKKRHCDKVVDCLFGDDEFDCWPNTAAHSSLLRLSTLDNQTRNVLGDNIVDSNTTTTENVFTTSKSQISKLPKFFTCKIMLQIIPFEEKCNKVVNCEDGTDESDCLCVDFIKKFHPEALCDGVTDCKDMSDEVNCALCQKDEYLCRSNRTCISSVQVCDGNADCINAEDEQNCVTLTDGETLTVDSDLRPVHSSKGVITINRSGVWRPLCIAASEPAAVASDVCNLLGFDGYRVYHKLPVADKPLSSKEKEGPTCDGLFVRCSEIATNDNVSAGAELYTLPWNALIYFDGEFRCTGTILDPNWIITAKACFQENFMTKSYIAALVGKGKAHLDVEGPHEQAIPITSTITIEENNAVLLHTHKKIIFDRYVKPALLTVSSFFLKEKCLAIGFEEDKSRFVILYSSKNCTQNFRCLNPESCSEVTSSKNWSGVITCDSRNGWYSAAIFDNVDGPCGFFGKEFVSIDGMKVKQTMKNGVSNVIEPSQCNGFRCILGRCINKQKMCDGIPDCRSGEDEDFNLCSNLKEQCHLSNGCSNNTTCEWTEFKCRNGKCIPKTSFCNNIDDCGNHFDEPTTCSCKTYMERVHPEKICDGTVNCWDRSDEDPKRCRCRFPTNITCGQTRLCISKEMICDGFKDCPDGEDERTCFSLKTNFSHIHSGEVMKRTAGVWHSACFNRNHTTSELEEICSKLGFAQVGSVKQVTVAKDNVTVPVRDRFDVVWVRRRGGNKFKLRLRTGNEPYVKFMKDTECHKLYIECL